MRPVERGFSVLLALLFMAASARTWAATPSKNQLRRAVQELENIESGNTYADDKLLEILERWREEGIEDDTPAGTVEGKPRTFCVNVYYVLTYLAKVKADGADEQSKARLLAHWRKVENKPCMSLVVHRLGEIRQIVGTPTSGETGDEPGAAAERPAAARLWPGEAFEKTKPTQPDSWLLRVQFKAKDDAGNLDRLWQGLRTDTTCLKDIITKSESATRLAACIDLMRGNAVALSERARRFLADDSDPDARLVRIELMGGPPGWASSGAFERWSSLGCLREPKGDDLSVPATGTSSIADWRRFLSATKDAEAWPEKKANCSIALGGLVAERRQFLVRRATDLHARYDAACGFKYDVDGLRSFCAALRALDTGSGLEDLAVASERVRESAFEQSVLSEAARLRGLVPGVRVKCAHVAAATQQLATGCGALGGTAGTPLARLSALAACSDAIGKCRLGPYYGFEAFARSAQQLVQETRSHHASCAPRIGTLAAALDEIVGRAAQGQEAGLERTGQIAVESRSRVFELLDCAENAANQAAAPARAARDETRRLVSAYRSSGGKPVPALDQIERLLRVPEPTWPPERERPTLDQPAEWQGFVARWVGADQGTRAAADHANDGRRACLAAALLLVAHHYDNSRISEPPKVLRETSAGCGPFEPAERRCFAYFDAYVKYRSGSSAAEIARILEETDVKGHVSFYPTFDAQFGLRGAKQDPARSR